MRYTVLTSAACSAAIGGAPMALVNDLHHIAFLTADLDRLISFYERIFDARVTLDLADPVRHAFIEIGPHTVLHPFEVAPADVPGRQPMFERGRLDHFALNAASEDAFREIRRRVVAEGANATEGGLVTDMGAILSFTLHDPDDAWVEVVWLKPGIRFEDAPTGPAEWKMIDLD
jgi:catechol 2,3-dioxygenase-like lactoylglutathione lyase family enzyme